MIRLYLTFLDRELPEIPEELLSSYRAEKLAGTKNKTARQQSIGAELLLRHALRNCGYPVIAPLELERAEYGKPYLRTGECFFSLSHSKQAVLCAVSDVECGADVQIIRPVNRALVERYYAPTEKEAVLSAEDPDETFTAIWAMKESYIKSSGLGMRIPLPSFSVLEPALSSHIWCKKINRFFLSVYGDRLKAEEIKFTQVKTSALLF